MNRDRIVWLSRHLVTWGGLLGLLLLALLWMHALPGTPPDDSNGGHGSRTYDAAGWVVLVFFGVAISALIVRIVASRRRKER